MGAIIETKLSSNPMVGAITGCRDTRDSIMIVAVTVKRGAFATDGSRWGEVKLALGTRNCSEVLQLKWLDDGNESHSVMPKHSLRSVTRG